MSFWFKNSRRWGGFGKIPPGFRSFRYVQKSLRSPIFDFWSGDTSNHDSAEPWANYGLDSPMSFWFKNSRRWGGFGKIPPGFRSSRYVQKSLRSRIFEFGSWDRPYLDSAEQWFRARTRIRGWSDCEFPSERLFLFFWHQDGCLSTMFVKFRAVYASENFGFNTLIWTEKWCSDLLVLASVSGASHPNLITKAHRSIGADTRWFEDLILTYLDGIYRTPMLFCTDSGISFTGAGHPSIIDIVV